VALSAGTVPTLSHPVMIGIPNILFGRMGVAQAGFSFAGARWAKGNITPGLPDTTLLREQYPVK